MILVGCSGDIIRPHKGRLFLMHLRRPSLGKDRSYRTAKSQAAKKVAVQFRAKKHFLIHHITPSVMITAHCNNSYEKLSENMLLKKSVIARFFRGRGNEGSGCEIFVPENLFDSRCERNLQTNFCFWILEAAILHGAKEVKILLCIGRWSQRKWGWLM